MSGVWNLLRMRSPGAADANLAFAPRPDIRPAWFHLMRRPSVMPTASHNGAAPGQSVKARNEHYV
jgi:hypothetical protein